jgi:hypothetical protein
MITDGICKQTNLQLQQFSESMTVGDLTNVDDTGAAQYQTRQLCISTNVQRRQFANETCQLQQTITEFNRTQ